jgi:hypothetical protein
MCPFPEWDADRARSVHKLAAGAGPGKAARRDLINGWAGSILRDRGEATMAGRCHGEAAGSRRSPQRARRCHRVEFTLTAEEFAAVADAAGRAGLARGAYAAQVVLADAFGSDGAASGRREELRELIRASGLLRRIGANLNQAVARLNATGQHSADLRAYAAESIRRARRLDAAAEAVRRTLR